MKSIHFPTTIIDGFFENPDLIREYALSLEYPFFGANFPGKRTERLHLINPILHDTIGYKLLHPFFSNPSYKWEATSHFQLINSNYGSGWVHKDSPCIITAIIYLTKESDAEIGTSLFDKKDLLDPFAIIEPPTEKKRYDVSIFEKESSKDIIKKEKNNSSYKEVIKVSGLYNRALIFDSQLYHAAHSFIGSDDNSSRLTFISFYNMINAGANLYPIPRMHSRVRTIL